MFDAPSSRDLPPDCAQCAVPLHLGRAAPVVLMVEDSALQRAVILDLLSAGAWRVLAATNGAEALAVLERQRPDIVLTDVCMPGMSGLEVLAETRARYPGLPVVLMTSRGSEQTAIDALRAGAIDYVPKRGLVSQLERVLERAADASRASAQRDLVLGTLCGRVSRYVLGNAPDLVTPLLTEIQSDVFAAGACEPHDWNRIAVALEEALLDAIYHGNLEVSSKLKEQGDAFHQLARERRCQRPYGERRVRVTVRVSRAAATFRIADEGPGFDVSKLPDPTDPEYLERPSGRGLLLMRAFMDEVRYNATGNRVTMTKRRTAPKAT
jgi:CheY-like chemotaxis protein/anti-sigma regulatory factor (Ser/Thr protein kinase)